MATREPEGQTTGQELTEQGAHKPWAETAQQHPNAHWKDRPRSISALHQEGRIGPMLMRVRPPDRTSCPARMQRLGG
jgi:hypothetical protein